MDFVWSLVEILFAPVAVFAALVYVLRKFFDRALDRDLERFRRQLDAELMASKARLEGEAQARLYEYQTRLSLYQQNRAEFVRELYARVTEFASRVRDLVDSLEDVDVADKTLLLELWREQKDLYEFYRELRLFFEKNKIYLEEDLNKQVSSILDEFSMLMFRCRNVIKMVVEGEHTMARHDASLEWELMDHDVYAKAEPLRRRLESEFRRIVQVELSHKDR